MLKNISKYFSLVKFSHTIFAMPFAVIGFFLAYQNYTTNWMTLVYVVFCMVYARNSAMAFNRFLDRKIDKLNPRTSKREIPDGKIKSKNALLFVIINSLFFVGTTFLINRLVFYLSPIALFVILFYSYTKRFTALCHFVLGVGLSLAPIGAFLSVSGEFKLLPILFSGIVLFWVSGFDIIYSLQDYEFDKKENLKSIPVLIGKKNAIFLSIFVHVLVSLIVVSVGIFWDFGILYWIGGLMFIGLLIYQHTLVKVNDLSKIGLAFGTTNGIASVIYAIFTVLEIIIKL